MKKLLFTLLSALALPAMAQGPYEQFKAQLTQPAGYGVLPHSRNLENRR